MRHPVCHTHVYKHTSVLMCICTEVHVLEVGGGVCVQLHIMYKCGHLHST